MAIKGCAEAPTHSREKQELPEGAKPIQTSSSGPADVSANGVETYGGSSKPSQPVTQPLTGPSLAAAQKAASAAANENGAKPVEKPEEKDPEDATVPNGAKCKRGGCGHVYAGEGKRDRSKEECKYHKGVAVFHEGSKVGVTSFSFRDYALTSLASLSGLVMLQAESARILGVPKNRAVYNSVHGPPLHRQRSCQRCSWRGATS